jgi:hypothetical protein
MAVIQTPHGGMSVPDPSGYEVIRGGQGYSTTKIQKGDIVIRNIYREGGSSSSRPSQVDLEAEAKRLAEEKVRQEELKRQQEEAKKLQEQIKKEREAKIEAGKISGQVTSTSGVIDKYQTYYGEYIEKKPSIKERVQGSIAAFFGNKRDEQPTLFSQWNIDTSQEKIQPLPYETRGTYNPLAPTLTRGEEYQKQKILTRGYDPVEFVLQDIEKEKVSEAQKNLDKSFEIIQGKVKEGKLTISEGEELLKKSEIVVNEKLQKEYEDEAKNYLKQRGFAESKNPKIDLSKDVVVSSLVKGGLIVGGLSVAPAPTTAALFSLGGIDVIKGSGLLVGGTDKQTKIRGGIQAGTGLVTMGLAGSSLFRNVEKQIVAEQFKELSKQPIDFKVVKVQGDKQSLDLIRGTQSYGGVTTKYNIVGKTIQQEGNKFIMPKGIGESITTGNLDWNILSSRTRTQIFGYQQFNIGSKGFSFNLLGDKVSGSLGSSTLIPKSSTGAYYTQGTSLKNINRQLLKNVKVDNVYYKDYFGGISLKKDKDFYVFKGGKIKSFDIQTTQPSGIEVDFGLKDSGVMKVIRLDSQKDRGFSFVSGSGTKSSQEYIKNLYSPQISSNILKQSQTASFKSITAPSFSGTLSPVISELTPTISKKEQINILSSPTTLKNQRQLQQSFLSSKTISPLKTRSSTQLTSLTKQRQLQSPLQSQIQRTGLKTKTLTKQTTRLINPLSPNLNIPYLTPNIKVPPGFGLPLIPFAELSERTKRTKTQRRKQKTKYQPSFTASILNIKAKKVPLLAPGGLQLRPIIDF